MEHHKITLTANGPSTARLKCHGKDKITWINDFKVNGIGVAIDLTLAPCVDPADGTIRLPPGAPAPKDYTVKDVAGHYNYEYQDVRHKTVQNGTIDVSLAS